MSVFMHTMSQAIKAYRQLLRKHLDTPDRIIKLKELGLKNKKLYTDEVELYHTGYRIIKDIRNNLSNTPSYGYYSYSGVTQFSNDLQAFLDDYVIDENHVEHRSQKASRAIVEAIQLLGLSRNQLTEKSTQKLADCNETIANCGSQEQHELHRVTLQNTVRRHLESNASYYRAIYNHFLELLSEQKKVANG